MNPVEPSSSNGQIDGMGGNQYNDAQQKLFEGVERGYNNVLHKLSQIENRLQILPKMTAETLSAQLQRRTDVKAVNEHQQDEALTSNIVEEMMTANQQEKSRLEERLQMASQELAASVAKEANLRNELLALKRDFARLEMKEVQFRDIIISNAATQQVTDQEVIQAFSELRQTVQQLAKNQAFDLAQTPLLVPPDAKQSDKHFYKKIQGLPPKDVNSRVRMRIWEIVYSYILSQTVFGLKKARNYDIEGEDGNRFLWDIEEGLTDFEDYLKASKKVSNRMIADWRVCTLQCIDLMELPGGYSSHVVNRMYSCFAPLISKNATKSLRDELGEKMLNVCTKAVALKMMMQHSKEGYNVQTVNLKEYPSYSNCRHFMESMGVEDGRASDASDDIAYVLFGVLMKYPMDTVGDNKVLLKAEVILKKNLRR